MVSLLCGVVVDKFNCSSLSSNECTIALVSAGRTDVPGHFAAEVDSILSQVDSASASIGV